MVHLLPLPGAPRYAGSTQEVIERAVADASVLVKAGFPALLVENFGDAPYPADRSDPETIAAMALAVAAVTETSRVPVGVNVLRNDALSALGIATVTSSRFIRVNVLIGIMYTDQGPISGRADQLLRRRAALAGNVEVWADVMVKHATPPPGPDIKQVALDTVSRGLADAVIVTGRSTGAEPDLEDAVAVRSVIPKETRLVIGSGVGPGNLARIAEVADSVIVGSSVEIDGVAGAPVDPGRASVLAEAARDVGLA